MQNISSRRMIKPELRLLGHFSLLESEIDGRPDQENFSF
jgi:hypothetical protein